MEHGFKMHWILVGAGAVIVGKIVANILSTKLGLSM